jgi:hypothetical protein
MEQWLKDYFKKSSVKLPDGGDTHFHPWKDEASAGVTVTTRLPKGIVLHQNVRDLCDGPAVSESRLSYNKPPPSPHMEKLSWRPPPVNPML